MNQFLYDDLTKSELFITLFYLQYHHDTRAITFASAGHSPTLIWSSRTQKCNKLDPEGLIIGVKRDFKFEKESLTLHSGDVMLLYTDGLIEAANDQDDFFGEARLVELLKDHHTLEPQELINHIVEQVQLFSGHHNFQDDVSMIILKCE